MLPAPALIRFVDERVPENARAAVAITASDPGYVFFGPRLDRRLDLLGRGAADTPKATWAFVSPSDQSAPRRGSVARGSGSRRRPTGGRSIAGCGSAADRTDAGKRVEGIEPS